MFGRQPPNFFRASDAQFTSLKMLRADWAQSLHCHLKRSPICYCASLCWFFTCLMTCVWDPWGDSLYQLIIDSLGWDPSCTGISGYEVADRISAKEDCDIPIFKVNTVTLYLNNYKACTVRWSIPWTVRWSDINKLRDTGYGFIYLKKSSSLTSDQTFVTHVLLKFIYFLIR